MKTVGLLQLRNELEQGNLNRCLDNMKKVCDTICIVDDASTDGSITEYLKYTEKDNILVANKRSFGHELYLKNALLQVAMKHNPDWFVWFDGDCILSRELSNRESLTTFLSDMDRRNHDGVYVHNMNMWRHPAYYRLDNMFNGLFHMVFWKNNGKLHYNPRPGLHQNQFPNGISNPFKTMASSHELLHYGFSSYDKIVRKYLTYKSFGQSGWNLNRLIDEQSSFVLKKVPKELFPDENIPDDYDTVDMPKPIDYNEIRSYNSFEEYWNAASKHVS